MTHTTITAHTGDLARAWCHDCGQWLDEPTTWEEALTEAEWHRENYWRSWMDAPPRVGKSVLAGLPCDDCGESRCKPGQDACSYCRVAHKKLSDFAETMTRHGFNPDAQLTAECRRIAPLIGVDHRTIERRVLRARKRGYLQRGSEAA